jgi:hypothetical protein
MPQNQDCANSGGIIHLLEIAIKERKTKLLYACCNEEEMGETEKESV